MLEAETGLAPSIAKDQEGAHIGSIPPRAPAQTH